MASPTKRARPSDDAVSRNAQASPVRPRDMDASSEGTREENPVGVGARRLQAAVEERYRLPPPPGKWSARRRLAFILVASTLLWGLLIGGALLLVRVITG